MEILSVVVLDSLLSGRGVSKLQVDSAKFFVPSAPVEQCNQHRNILKLGKTMTFDLIF